MTGRGGGGERRLRSGRVWLLRCRRVAGHDAPLRVRGRAGDTLPRVRYAAYGPYSAVTAPCEEPHEPAPRLRHRRPHPRGPEPSGARRRLVVRDQADPLRRGPGPDDRRPRGADLPVDVLRLPRHAARGRRVLAGRAGQHLHPHPQPHPGRPGAAHRRAGRRGRRRRAGFGAGRRDARDPDAGRGRGPHRVLPVAVRRHLQPLPSHAAPVRHRGDVRRGPGRPGGLAGRGPAQHEGVLRRDARQSARRRAGRPGRRGHRARGRGAAHRRQHRAHPLPAAADRARRGHRGPLGDQVPRRARHDDRRRGRGQPARSTSGPTPTVSPTSTIPTRATTGCATGPTWARVRSR